MCPAISLEINHDIHKHYKRVFRQNQVKGEQQNKATRQQQSTVNTRQHRGGRLHCGQEWVLIDGDSEDW